MKNNLSHLHFPQTEYWDRIVSILSSYEEKTIQDGGKITNKTVYDDYFLVYDTWDLDYIGQIPNFKDQYEHYKGKTKKLQFLAKSSSINAELKFIVYSQLFSDMWSLSTIWGPLGLKHLTSFLNEKYPNLTSLLDLDIEKGEKHWIFWLNNKGIKTRQVTKNAGKEYESNSTLANFFRSICQVLFQLTDTREEWEKERWDVRVLYNKYGIDYSKGMTHYFLDFSKIENVKFSKVAKEYIKNRLLTGKQFSWSRALEYMGFLAFFFNSISAQEPSWNNLRTLERKHIETYLEELRAYVKHRTQTKNANPVRYINISVSSIRFFLGDIQRYEKLEWFAPDKSVSRLIYPEDIPARPKKAADNVDHIPDYILERMFDPKNFNDLHPEVQPVAWVALKTGLRISDCLELKQECLLRFNGTYSVKADIRKVKVKRHTIPIDEELAGIIAVLIRASKENSNEDNNPNKYIFVRYRGSRKGNPYSRGWVAAKINDFIREKNIRDEMGNLFHFRNHQFRHTYGVKMINGGTDILTVQQLMAHASPEMTLVYARLLEDTKRKEFDRVANSGAFTFDLNGKITEVKEHEDIPEDILDMLWQNHKLNAIDNPYGTCHALVNGNCPIAAEPPCLTANDGKPCSDLSVGFSDMDVKKYEIYIESARKMVEASKEHGRDDMAETNQKNLERYQEIYQAIKGGNVIFGRMDALQRQSARPKRKSKKKGDKIV